MVSQTNKPKIGILATGGTIASTAPDKTQLSDYQVSAGIQDMVNAVPALADLADFVFEQICNVESHRINDDVLLPLAQAVQALCDREDVSGVVITHGTDTLEETAYFLHLTVDTDKPIVLVGAMRPSSAISADGPLNLFHAVSVAAHPASIGQGVLVVMNDRIASARHVTKGHANGVDAFVPTEFGYLGLVAGRWVRYQNRVLLPHTSHSGFRRFNGCAALPEVDVIYDHQGAGVHFYRAAIDSGAKGIVLAATGQGSLSPQATEGVEIAIRSGVLVVRSSRVWQGVVRASIKDNQFCTVPAYTLNPAKARVLLRLALAKGMTREQTAQCFETY